MAKNASATASGERWVLSSGSAPLDCARGRTAERGRHCAAQRLTEQDHLPCQGWPFVPFGTCEVIRFKRNSRNRFETASAPIPARPLNTISEPPRSEDG